MPEKHKVIRQCMAEVRAAVRCGEPSLCETLFQQVHRLAGSAGSYGFDSLGVAASAVDRYLIAKSMQAADLPELSSLLQNLLDEIDVIIRNQG